MAEDTSRVIYSAPLHPSSTFHDVLPADGVFVFVNDSFTLNEPVAKRNEQFTTLIPSPAPVVSNTTSTPSCAGLEPGAGRASGGGRGGKRDPLKTPRPQNAFMIYRREKHPSVVAVHKGLHNKEVSRIVGQLWRNESEEVHRVYERKADFAKLEHKVKYPGYKYAPRKPAKKRPKQPRKVTTCETSGGGNGPSGGSGGGSGSGSGDIVGNDFIVDSTSMYSVPVNSNWDNQQSFHLGPFSEGLQCFGAPDNILACIDQFTAATPPSDCLEDKFKFEDIFGIEFVDSQQAFFSTFPLEHTTR